MNSPGSTNYPKTLRLRPMSRQVSPSNSTILSYVHHSKSFAPCAGAFPDRPDPRRNRCGSGGHIHPAVASALAGGGADGGRRSRRGSGDLEWGRGWRTCRRVIPPGLDEHEEWGERTRNLAILSSLLAVGAVVAIRFPTVSRGAGIAAAVAGMAASYAVAETGHYGGLLVYKHGVGVNTAAGTAPAAAQPAPPATTKQND